MTQLATERQLNRAAGHDEDAVATPGPLLSFAHPARRRPPTHWGRAAAATALTAALPHRIVLLRLLPALLTLVAACTACASAACPTFALHSLTPPLLSVSRQFVYQRIVFVGASDTALSALVALLTADSPVYFTSLTLISLQPLAALSADAEAAAAGSRQLSVAASAVPHADFAVDTAMLRRICLEARVQLVTGRVVDVDSAQQMVTVEVTDQQAGSDGDSHAGADKLLIPYDELILTSGLQPTTARTVSSSQQQQHHQQQQQQQLALAQSTSVVNTPHNGTAPSPQQQFQHLSTTHQLPPAEASGVSGVWPLSSHEHAEAFLAASLPQLLPSSAASHPSARALPSSPPAVVVSGASLAALTAISTLLSVGVPGECISWVHACSNLSHLATHPASTDAAVEAFSSSNHSLSVAVLGDELPLMTAILNTLSDEHIRIVQRETVAAVHVKLSNSITSGISQHNHSGDSDPAQERSVFASVSQPKTTSRHVQSVSLSNGDVLPCSILLQSDDIAVDSRLLDIAVRRLGLVHDGRFVVDGQFRSASLPNVRLAGPLAKFQRGLLRSAVDAAAAASSNDMANKLGVRLLDHSFYSSVSIGRALATVIERTAALLVSQQSKSYFQSNTASKDVSHVDGQYWESLHTTCCVRRAVLPGSLAFFHAWSPSYCVQPSPASERVLTHSFPSYTFSVHICTNTLRIVRLRYWGVFDLVSAHSLTRLIGLPVTYCNRLLWRWENNQIKSLLLFLQQDWTQILYAPSFSTFRDQLIQQLAQLYAGQLNPILDKLTTFQQTLVSDQYRQHEQQQLQNQRRSSTIKSALPLPMTSQSSSSDSVDMSVLQSLNAFLPTQFREVVHRAVVTFIASQQQTLPASLQPLSLQFAR